MRHKIEVFSAGCPCCEEAVRIVNSAAGPSDDIQVLDMHQPDVTARAKQYGVKSVPAVAIDGKLADCCAGRGVDESTVRAAL